MVLRDMEAPDFKEFNLTFDGYLCDVIGVNEPEFMIRYTGRSLLRSCLTFNDMELADDPWDYNIAKNRKAGDNPG